MENSKESLVERAYHGLFPEREYRMNGSIKYSGKFSAYNANVMLRLSTIQFGLSREWEDVDDEIVIGLLQHLMVRVFNTERTSPNIGLYEIFLKKVHKSAPRIQSPPELIAAFEIINDEYFAGMMDMPNLQWGSASFRRFGSYHYGSDIVTLSTALKDQGELMHYVLYHELLHKKHKYKVRGKQNFHHTPAFKKDEALFRNAAQLEKDLGKLARKKRTWKSFLDF